MRGYQWLMAEAIHRQGFIVNYPGAQVWERSAGRRGFRCCALRPAEPPVSAPPMSAADV